MNHRFPKFEKYAKSFGLSLLLVLLMLAICACGADVRLGAAISGPSVDAQAAAQTVSLAMDDLLEENFDSYAAYFTLAEYESFYADYVGSYGGIGIYLLAQEEQEYPVIVNTMLKRPADLAGVLPGDVLLAIDGQSTANMSSDEVSSLVKGEIGTAVTLRVRHAESGETEDITITREAIEVESVAGTRLLGTDDLAYIAVYDFNSHTAEEFLSVMENLEAGGELRGLIIDLRSNGGGSVAASVSLASYFVPDDEVVMWQKTKYGMVPTYAKSEVKYDLPVVILQNGYTASASEIFIGALRDHCLAVTVGTQSYGKGITQLIYQLADGDALRFTETKYYTPSQYDLHETGIAPVVLSESEPGFIINIYSPSLTEDKQLATAVEVLNDYESYRSELTALNPQ